MDTTQFTPITLQADQRLHVSVDAGTVVRVKSGSISLTEPFRWLGNVVITPTHALSAGDEFKLERGGWIIVEAWHGAAELMHGVEPSAFTVALQSVSVRFHRFVEAISRTAGLSRP